MKDTETPRPERKATGGREEHERKSAGSGPDERPDHRHEHEHHHGRHGCFPFDRGGHGGPGRWWRGFRAWGGFEGPPWAMGAERRSDFPGGEERFNDMFDEEHDGPRGGRPMRGRGERGFGGFGGFGPGHRERGGFGPPWRGGRPGRRPFEQGDLRWLMLDLIAAQPRHGYEIIKAIEEAMDGNYSPSPGVIYPTLTLLEETGLITGEAHGAKKLYSVTEAGRAELAANASTVEAVRMRLKEARAHFGEAPAPEVMRAIGNLRHAIQVRLSKGSLSEETVSAITAAIDRAAGEIERS